MSRAGRIESIFDRAVGLASPERAAFLDEACADDVALRREIDELLAFDEAAPGPIDRAAAAIQLVRDGDTRPAGDAPTVPAGAVRASPERRLDQPRQVGAYEVLGKLGEGGMGAVFDAYDATLHRRVALKIVLPSATGAAARTRLLREAQALARVSHPNVVAIHEVATWEDGLYIAMERVDGRTLGDWLTESPRDWRTIVAALRDAGRGLAAAHEAGLVHRDFKPDNILVDRSERVRVVDFGLARARSGAPSEGDAAPPISSSGVRALELDLTREGTLMGTPRYMSPEHFRGRDVDARSDQFGFGLVAYRALWGSAPFEGESIGELRRAVLEHALRPPPARSDPDAPPRDVEEIVLRCLAPSPDERFSSMAEVVQALDAALASSPDSDASIGRIARRRLIAAVIAVGGATYFVVLLTTGARFSSEILIQQSLVSVALLAGAGLMFRRHLRTRYNRVIASLVALPIAAFLVHRVAASARGTPPLSILIGDAMIQATAMALGAALHERWMGWNALLATSFVALAIAIGDAAMPAFPPMLFACAAVAVASWRDATRRPDPMGAVASAERR